MQLFLNTPKLNSFSQWSQSDNRSLIHEMHYVRQDQGYPFETPRRVWSGQVPANDPAWTLIAKNTSPVRQEATTTFASVEMVVRGQLLSHEGDYVTLYKYYRNLLKRCFTIDAPDSWDSITHVSM